MSFDPNQELTFIGANIPVWLKGIVRSEMENTGKAQQQIIADALLEYFTARRPTEVSNHVNQDRS